MGIFGELIEDVLITFWGCLKNFLESLSIFLGIVKELLEVNILKMFDVLL